MLTHGMNPINMIIELLFIPRTILLNSTDLEKKGISDIVTCKIGRSSNFTSTDQRTWFKQGRRLWVSSQFIGSAFILLHFINKYTFFCFHPLGPDLTPHSWRHCRWLLPPAEGICSLYPLRGLGFCIW